jgi:hypothetical protein
MTNFLLDLWNDLRAKRLWPVALVLLAALVATPVVLSKSAEAPEPAATTPAPDPAKAEKPEGPAELAEVKLEELAGGSGSSLSSFDPRNPFAPPKKALEAARRNAAGSSAPSTATSGGAGTGAGSGSGIGSGLIDAGPAAVDVTPGSAGGTIPDIGGSPTPEFDSGGGATGDGHSDQAKATEYTYVVDVTFRTNDRERTVKGLKKLDMLPDAASPLLIFVGVTEKAGNAVFMVDSTLHAAGEGRCKPSRDECATLYLGPGSEHEFTTDEGDSYTLRIDEIRLVKVEAKANASKTSASKNVNKIASAALGPDASARRSVPPVLADLVSVSAGEGDNSNSDRDSR